MPDVPAGAAPVLMQVDRHRLGRFELRLLSSFHLEGVMALREQVLAQLPDADLYVREHDERGFVAAHLGGMAGAQGETIGAFDGDRLIGYAMLGLPAPGDPDNLGLHLPQAAGRLGQVAHIASCMVLPECRGHGLQRVMLGARLLLAQAHGRTICAGMVSLHNHASRRNLMREGLRIMHVGQVAGLQRQILALRLGQPWTFATEQAQLVGSTDYARQCALAQAGWCGVSALEGQGQDMLVFARLAGDDAHADSPR
jgi:GNAT superfamily N-acetyltransferase